MHRPVNPFAQLHHGPLSRLCRGLREDGGQAAILAAVGMIAILAFLGLAIDVGHLRYVKRQLQIAADAAAVAGALEIQSCGGTKNCSAMQVAAQDALTENGFGGSWHPSARTHQLMAVQLVNTLRKDLGW